ncbi:MAG: DUF5916 domain-containing protein [Gemmatimonadota bacterium]|nr:DUF5916 domain-containing protein [Gemmatimonadota bacterium]
MSRRTRSVRAGLVAVIAASALTAGAAAAQTAPRYRIQVALRDDAEAAEAAARRVHRLLEGELAVYVVPWERRHRVRVGDFATTGSASWTLRRVRSLGFADAWLAPANRIAPTLTLPAGGDADPETARRVEPSPPAPDHASDGEAAPTSDEAESQASAPANGGAEDGDGAGPPASSADGDPTGGSPGPASAAEVVWADGRGAYEGHHEASDCRRSAGWVWDRTQPGTPLEVEVYDNGHLLGTAPADVSRAGLLERGKGNGSHAFYFTHPETLWDGRVHDLEIRVGGGEAVLLASPKRLACGQDGEPIDAASVRSVPKTARAGRAAGAIAVDGRLDEEAWARASFRSDFLQKGHDQGYRSRVRTRVAFLFDDEAIYVGARMLAAPDRPVGQVRGRDDPGSDDRILVSLDTHLDLQTAYTFGVTEGGTRLDHFHPSDRELPVDRTFDPVWEAKTASDSTGWTAEMRIPFSQLRFSAEGRQVWGLNVKRENPSRFVSLYWVVVPTYEEGWSSRFGELVGVETGELGRRVEVSPYVLGSASFLDAGAGGTGGVEESETRVGGDLKLGVGPNLTVDATFNPDFGQVEADPAEVNLSAFETFFPERRPFFQEGAQLLRGGGPDYFYSRRIGSLPRGVTGEATANAPGGATILGASKLTGRLESGLSVGALAAVTQAEAIPPTGVGADTLPSLPVSPATGFGVARVQKEIGAAGSSAGFMLTGVQRDLDSGLASILASRAFAGGADWNLRLGHGTYELRGHAGFSHVSGDSAAIDRLQRSSVRYLQRPDADHVRLDPSATSLSGYTAGVELAKIAGAPWLWEASASTTSPGFELNDAGILRTADEHRLAGSLTHRRLGLQGPARQFSLGAFGQGGWNHGGVRLGTSVGLFGNAVWRNFWRTYAQVQLHTAALSDDLTRGGPLMGTPAAFSIDLGLTGSHAAPTLWSVSASGFFDDFGGWATSLDASVSMRPNPRLEVSLSPGISFSDASRQFFDVFPGGPESTFGQRYVFARLDRSEVYAQLRIGYAISPDLTLELYGEPFASSARFHDFGELEGAGRSGLRLYGEDGSTVETLEDGSVVVTDGADSFTLWNSDFRLRSFRSNAVLKWEWQRGSTLYLIWQQNRWFWDGAGDHIGAGSLFRSVADPGEHILVAKLSYWLSFR